ncbi:MAG: sugar ABC transporter permease, partial [Chloroflexota bacterium]|nr:sugar ABC transporter permease [Chloroflexota bacterium]
MTEGALTSSRKVVPARRRRGIPETWLSPLILSPSLIAVFVFVYGFIGMTIWVSISNWRSPERDLSLIEPLWSTYQRLFQTTRFQIDIRNTIVFTIFFLVFSVGVGLLLAIVLDQALPARALIRNIFLFPYALSFVVTGVAWRWIFNPDAGINLLFDYFGINWLLGQFGAGPIRQSWLTNPDVLGNIPVPSAIKAEIGLPIALFPIIIAAVWQL